MKEHIPIRDYWEAEVPHMKRVDVWQAKAFELKLVCDHLVQRERDQIMNKLPEASTAMWTAGVARMLMAFSLENQIKALFFHRKDLHDQLFVKDGNLNREVIGTHDLLKLSGMVGLAPGQDMKEDLEFLSMCGTWISRYPFPLNENDLPLKRPSGTQDELLARSKAKLKRAAKKGEPPELDVWDRMYGGIGREYDTFLRLYSRFDLLIESVITKSQKEEVSPPTTEATKKPTVLQSILSLFGLGG